MTREEAIESLELLKIFDAPDLAEAVKIAAAALRAQQATDHMHGYWQGEGDGYADGELVYDVWHCSHCGHTIDDGTDDPELLPNYCPDCGVKMDGDVVRPAAKLDRSRWEGCDTCNNVPGIMFGVITMAVGKRFLSKKEHQLRFCPECGKPITEEAWAEQERRIGGNDESTDLF